jgi:hypothetical protein
MYADKQRAKEMMDYPHRCLEDRENNVRSDFWTGTLCRDQERKGLFSQITDVALALSSDGVKVFKTRSAFNIWPIMLVRINCVIASSTLPSLLTYSQTNLNLPPSVRFKRRNMLLVGFTPGPSNPKDFDSFLWPLVEEFLKLEQGIETWNAATEQYFDLHAYIPLVTADMPGREKLMHLKGNRAYSFCNYCLCRGIHNGSAIYCPFIPPKDPPEELTTDPANAKQKGYPWPSHDCRHLPLRNDSAFRQDAAYIASDPGHTAAQKKTGIAGQSVLHRLSSIDFPRSFPPDSMHLFYENIIPDMVKHYRGVFFKPKAEPDPDAENSRKRKSQPPEVASGPQSTKRPKTGGTQESTKFHQTDDSWNVPPAEWKRIGEDQQASSCSLPYSFGRAPRNFAAHCHEFSGEEWKQQATLFLPIYLQDVLPREHYEQFCALTQAMNDATENIITDPEIDAVEDALCKFLGYYERTFYNMEWAQLPACLPVFHQLAHVADALRWIGPMPIYAQWGMERMCGILTSSAKSRVDANRNMELTLQKIEQKHMLGFVVHPDDWIPTGTAIPANTVEDTDGNLLLSRVFGRRIGLSRPPLPRSPLTSSMANYVFDKMVEQRPLEALERQRLKAYVQGLAKHAHLVHLQSFSFPANFAVHTWKWCHFRDDADNTKVDFKITSAAYRPRNNTRNSSMIAYEREPNSPNPDNLDLAYGEVQFFFSLWLPAELPHAALEQPDQADGGGPNTAMHHLAYIQDIPVVADGSIVRRQIGGGFKVIAVKDIGCQIGLMQKGRGKGQYLVRKYGALMWRDA